MATQILNNEVRASQLAQASERVGSLIPASPDLRRAKGLRPEEDQSIWSKCQQGFQPCCEAGIREPTLYVSSCLQS